MERRRNFTIILKLQELQYVGNACGLKLGFSFLDQGCIEESKRCEKSTKVQKKSVQKSPLLLEGEVYLYLTEMLF